MRNLQIQIHIPVLQFSSALSLLQHQAVSCLLHLVLHSDTSWVGSLAGHYLVWSHLRSVVHGFHSSTSVQVKIQKYSQSLKCTLLNTNQHHNTHLLKGWWIKWRWNQLKVCIDYESVEEFLLSVRLEEVFKRRVRASYLILRVQINIYCRWWL